MLQNKITSNWLWGWPGILSKEMCNSIIKEYSEGEQKFKKGLVGDDINGEKIDPSIRQTDIMWLDQMTPIGCIMQAYANAANYYANWRFNFEYMENVQFSRYTEEENSFYDWHVDISPPIDGLQRKVSIVVLLSDPKDFEGGQFEMEEYIDSDVNHKILEKQGSIVVFPSFMSHRVTEVTKGCRYTAVSWMVGPAFK